MVERRPPAGTEAGSTEETRARLAAAGLELFGRLGFDGVTTRALAERAGVNQAAIPYHFGGKEGVYMAVAQRFVELAAPRIAAAIADAPCEPAASPAEAGAMLERFLLRLCDIMLGPDVPEHAFAFLFREQFQPTRAFELLYRELMQPVHAHAGELLARAVGEDPASPRLILMEHAFFGLLTAFVSSRATLLHRLEADVPPDLDAVGATLRRLIACLVAGAGILDRPLPCGAAS
ncbi:MAG: CerR family C-terminal domain-containing protein [Zoogloea sp.]|nr:CerR family C-terminal domain-containing protein [Zoogloea sp.]